MLYNFSKAECEYIRISAKQKFDKVKSNWIECGRWAAPWRTKWLLGQQEGQRVNQHVVDATHIIALRSYVAGFLEGNTSASRPWYRISHQDKEINRFPENRSWLDRFTDRTLYALASSNFYDAAGLFYYDYGTFNTGAYYIEETKRGLHFHNLTPGSYYALNNSQGVADALVREFTLTVKALVEQYGKKVNGRWDWSNFSDRVRKMYEDSNYGFKIDVVTIVRPNHLFNLEKPISGANRQFVSLTYENFSGDGPAILEAGGFGQNVFTSQKCEIFLNVAYSKRKPFMVGKSQSNDNYEYGEAGPTLDSLGLIKSLNKKAISKDIAMDQMLRPPVQGPANLKKSYIATSPGSYVPLDVQSMAQGGLKQVFQTNPAIATINGDVTDMRDQVDKLYYSDYLLYLTRNPKTRTATETNAVVTEQQLIIGPNLQSLNGTHNNPVIEFVMDYVLDNDEYLEDPPEQLQGQFLKTDVISVFAQAQKAADLPAIDRYVGMIQNVGQLQPKVFDKLNLDRLADLYEDRLFLPEGLNNAQSKVDRLRQQAEAQAQRQQAINETIPNLAGAAKNLGIQQKQ